MTHPLLELYVQAYTAKVVGDTRTVRRGPPFTSPLYGPNAGEIKLEMGCWKFVGRPRSSVRWNSSHGIPWDTVVGLDNLSYILAASEYRLQGAHSRAIQSRMDMRVCGAGGC